MEINIKPCRSNTFPLKAIFIKNESIAFCLKEIQLLNWNLGELEIFPVPGLTANSICGYLVIPKAGINTQGIGRHEALQLLGTHIFIPERTEIYPAVPVSEIEKLLSPAVHFFHPEFGLAELTEKLDLDTLVLKPRLRAYKVTRPEDAVFIPREIVTFQIQALSPEDAIQNMEENIFPKQEKMETEPLNLSEKVKLGIYKLLFKSGAEPEEESGNKKSGFWHRWKETLKKDFENLEERNEKEVDKLMNLLKNDPLEALKYAIPLDDKGTSRGGSSSDSAFNLSKRWPDFSLFGSRTGAGSGSIDLGDNYGRLRQQYFATARQLIEQKEHQKAAFVYLKLLDEPVMAADALFAGAYYQEAASIYLKYTTNKERAAECYELGNMVIDAIEIYKELGRDEKVGDLYMKIHRKTEAYFYFEKVARTYTAKEQFVKASLIYKDKMDNKLAGQSMLLAGWRSNKDAYNCLNNYFANIEDLKVLKKNLESIYLNDVKSHNSEDFLRVIRHEYSKKNVLSDFIKEMAYQVIAAEISVNPNIVTELRSFNLSDPELARDILRFKLLRRSSSQ